MSATLSARPLPAGPPERAAEAGAQGYTVQQATRLRGLSKQTLRYCECARLLVEQGDPVRAGAIVAQIACEHFSREP